MLAFLFLKVFRSLVICRHNSLVGQTINACGNLSSLLISCKRGKPKAAVFPVPVWARPMKSLVPCNNTGIAFSWIGVGCVNPKILIELRRPSSRPNES
jgi:hypothetical protein